MRRRLSPIPTLGSRAPGLLGAVRFLCAGLLAVSAAIAQPKPTPEPGPGSVPAHRQAGKVAVIVIDGPIDAWTARSVERRIGEAQAAGAGAIVFELDTPGGEVGAVLRIANAIKGGSIPNSVAWVHPDAYSGGAIIALACREIVMSDPGAIGDAFQVIVDWNPTQGRAGLRAPTADERTKILPVIMSDVVDSARRSGYDEFLVQAMVIDGVELWLVEDTRSGRRYAVNEAEYRALFAADPPRGKPMLAGVTGGRYRAGDEGPTADTAEPISAPPPQRPAVGEPDDGVLAPPEETPESRRFRPAGEHLRDVALAFEADATRLDLEIATESNRPDFASLTEPDRERFRYVAYVNDGTSAVILRTPDALRLGLATRVINTDEELRAFFGASELSRSTMNWSEHAAAFMANPIVRGVLIVVFLLALFIEMINPGLTVPVLISLLALAGLLGPPLLVGMAGWWEVAAIGAGLVMIGVEVFVLPGFGLFGVLGLVGLFVGLVGTFIPDRPGLGSNNTDLAWGVTTVLLALLTSGVGMFFVARHARSFPLLGRLVLTPQAPEESELAAMAPPAADGPAVGEVGLALTPLRPVGQAEFGDRVVDVTADMGYVESGRRVRVTANERFRILVEPVREGTA